MEIFNQPIIGYPRVLGWPIQHIQRRVLRYIAVDHLCCGPSLLHQDLSAPVTTLKLVVEHIEHLEHRHVHSQYNPADASSQADS